MDQTEPVKLNADIKPVADPSTIEEFFDLQDLSIFDIQFLKEFLSNFGNATAAIMKLRPHIHYSTARVEGNLILRKLRKKPYFWDMLGLGYSDLKKICDTLKTTDPGKAADIMMKVNKEDAQDVNHTGAFFLVKEPDLDE